MKIPFKIAPESTTANLFDVVGEKIELALGDAIRRGGKWEFEMKRPTRTTAQNNALYLFLGWLADALNESHNLLMMKYFGKEFEVEWTVESAKERIWKPIQKAITGKESTAKLTTSELSQIAEEIRKNLSAKLGIILEFPNELARQLGVNNYEIIK